MDESRKAFNAWMSKQPYQDFYESLQCPAWQAAAEWARKDERERLARLAEGRLAVSKSELHAETFQVISRIMVAGLSADEIRAGKLNEP